MKFFKVGLFPLLLATMQVSAVLPVVEIECYSGGSLVFSGDVKDYNIIGNGTRVIEVITKEGRSFTLVNMNCIIKNNP